MLRRTARRVRRSCRACGAVTVTTARWAGTPRGHAAAPAADPLAAFAPTPMVRWLRGRTEKAEGAAEELLPAAPDRLTLARWYSEFDDFVLRARSSAELRARYDALHEGAEELREERLLAKPPKFVKVVGALNAACFDLDIAVRRLLPGDADAALVAVTRERVRHVFAWLAGPGADQSWIAATGLEPRREDIEALLAEPELLPALRGPGAGVLFTALFGVRKGPGAVTIVELFSEPAVRSALRAYLDSGDRPLLAELRSRLAAGADR
ncbi:hypothetical protein [Actinomadura hibisca]|uniref:hypothetical protein n=1 Tax=Actinomadura hibisca TaxID=68565 RepID=UPI00082B408C|nr:hypothetical protein [Actinomadura hibisca]